MDFMEIKGYPITKPIKSKQKLLAIFNYKKLQVVNILKYNI